MFYTPCNSTFRMERKMHSEWNAKRMVSDIACNGTFNCCHMTDNPQPNGKDLLGCYLINNIAYWTIGSVHVQSERNII